MKLTWKDQLIWARMMLKFGAHKAAYETLVRAMMVARRDNAPIEARALIIIAVNAAHEMAVQ